MFRKGDSSRGKRDNNPKRESGFRRNRPRSSSNANSSAREPVSRSNARSPPPRGSDSAAPVRRRLDNGNFKVSKIPAPNVPVKAYVEWPTEKSTVQLDDGLSDPSMPTELTAVIGYCSDQNTADLTSSLVSPTDVHKSVQEAKKFLFGSELEAAMKSSLAEYTKVIHFKDC